MKRYLIEREMPGVGGKTAAEICHAAEVSNQAIAQLAPRVQWQHSYVAGDRTFCIYLAEDPDGVREHARLSGFPANRIVEIGSIIDPTTAAGAAA
mgnify:FL=1|jgi:hypothetical protein